MYRPRFLAILFGLLALAVVVTPASVAAPPSNDGFAHATVVGSLPFSDSVTITEATTEPGEPLWWSGQSRTVWWKYAPISSGIVRVRRTGDSFGFLAVYRADSAGLGGLTRLTLNPDYTSPGASTATFEAGETYYLQSGDDYPYGWTNTVGIRLEEVAPPANDHFDAAIPITSVPFSDTRDMTAATLEPNEPKACGGTFEKSIWYAFSPTASGSYGQHGASHLNVYTGPSLADLTSVACSDWPGLYFYAEAGTTYYIQATNGGIALDAIADPDPGWDYSPGDPSRFDEIVFRHGFGYWDPTITEYLWDFGDGTTGSGQGATHRYLADGDYEATLTVNARGGRTASHTRTVQVRTHDVSILWSSVPGRGRVGRAGPIEIGVGNTRYPETVQVDFYKNTQAGLQHLGSVTKLVPAMQAKKTVYFSLSYTFTSDDLAAAKVSFHVIASIQGARDAFAGDNTATPPPTLVTR